MIKAVLFDMDNTLHNLDAAVLAAADAVFCYCKEDFFFRGMERRNPPPR